MPDWRSTQQAFSGGTAAGTLTLTTEFGIMEVPPGEVCVVQCGIRFSVALPGGCARGYVLEVFGSHFILPDLGPVGELAHPELHGPGYPFPALWTGILPRRSLARHDNRREVAGSSDNVITPTSPAHATNVSGSLLCRRCKWLGSSQGFPDAGSLVRGQEGGVCGNAQAGRARV